MHHTVTFSGLTAISLAFLAAAGILIVHNRTVEHRARQVFLGSCITLFCITLVDWFNYTYSAIFPNLGLFHSITTMLTFAVAPMLPVAISQTIFPERHVKWLSLALVLHALFELASLFGGYVFWVDATNIYHRGPLYLVYMLTYTMSAIYLSIESIRAGATYQSVNLTSILAILGVMVLGVGIQLYNGDIRTTWPSVSMSVFLYFHFYTDMVLRTDALTKLLNRHSYDEFCDWPELPCTVVLIDVDNFKHVNDTYGHAYGDECLITIAKLIRRSYGRGGLCYRTGGDEFVVILTKNQSEVGLMTYDLFSLVVKEQARDNRLPSVSAGHARTSEACPTIAAAASVADQRMYQLKRRRKENQRANNDVAN